MKAFFQFSIAAIILSLISCQQKSESSQDESLQTPVTEDDKTRYNISPNDHAIIRSQDSSIMDSITVDTLK